MTRDRRPPPRGGGSGRNTGRRVTALGVLAEVVITLGVIVGLFVVWQVWINNAIAGATQHAASAALSQQWASSEPTAPTAPATAATPSTPVVATAPKGDAAFGNLIVPRFGKDFLRPISQGVGFSVLDNISKGLGHYSQSQMPGEVGNFALASHRSAYGGAFHLIHHLRVGDSIYVETKDGWYRYIYRNTEYVPPTSIAVIAAVPQQPDATPTERLLTMTTCNPFYSSAERMIAYAVFDSWYPRAGGPPPEIASIVAAEDS